MELRDGRNEQKVLMNVVVAELSLVKTHFFCKNKREISIKYFFKKMSTPFHCYNQKKTVLQGKFGGNPFLTPRSTSAFVNTIPDNDMSWGQEFYTSCP